MGLVDFQAGSGPNGNEGIILEMYFKISPNSPTKILETNIPKLELKVEGSTARAFAFGLFAKDLGKITIAKQPGKKSIYLYPDSPVLGLIPLKESDIIEVKLKSGELVGSLTETISLLKEVIDFNSKEKRGADKFFHLLNLKGTRDEVKIPILNDLMSKLNKLKESKIHSSDTEGLMLRQKEIHQIQAEIDAIQAHIAKTNTLLKLFDIYDSIDKEQRMRHISLSRTSSRFY